MIAEIMQGSLNVGQSGTGTLNIKQKGHVDGGYLRLGSSTGGVGTVNVEERTLF